MPHFFIPSDNIKNTQITINDEQNYNHIAKSLRAKPNEHLLLIDENKIQYETVIESITKNEIIVQIEKSYKSQRELPFNLYLGQSPLRSDSQNFVIEKATELGVKGVYPFHSDNCAVTNEVITKKIPKWQKIMYEASKQCERADIPKCFELEKLENITKNFDRVIVFCERIATKTIKDIEHVKENENILVLIGPEGGFSKREFEFFEEQKFEMLTLGDLILKAETAVVVALGNIIYEFSGKN